MIGSNDSWMMNIRWMWWIQPDEILFEDIVLIGWETGQPDFWYSMINIVHEIAGQFDRIYYIRTPMYLLISDIEGSVIDVWSENTRIKRGLCAEPIKIDVLPLGAVNLTPVSSHEAKIRVA